MGSAEANSVATLFGRTRGEPKMLVAEVCNRILGRPRAQRGHVISDLILDLSPRFISAARQKNSITSCIDHMEIHVRSRR